MQDPFNRSVVIISALLTLLVLAGATLAVGFRNGWLQLATDAPSDAYAQIESLQTAPSQVAPGGDADRRLEHGDNDHRERGSRRGDSDDD